MVKAIFFNLGHTLTKEIDVSGKIDTLLSPFGLDWERFYPYWKDFYLLRSVGKITNDKEMFLLLERVLKQKNIPLQEIRDVIIFESHIIPKENIETLKKIKQKYKIGLITNFVYEWTKEAFKVDQIDNLFDVLIISSKIGVRKPDVKIFYKALKSLSIKATDAIFVSSNLCEDLICAKGYGIRTIWLDEQKIKRKKETKIAEFFKYKPDAIIKNLTEVIPAIKRIK